jgi:hypothetical protein
MQACLQQHWATLGAECQLYTHAAKICDFMAIREVCTGDGGGSGPGRAARVLTTTTVDSSSSTGSGGSTGGSGSDARSSFGDASTPQRAADCVEAAAAAHAKGRARISRAFLNFSHADCAAALRALPVSSSSNRLLAGNESAAAGSAAPTSLAGEAGAGNSGQGDTDDSGDSGDSQGAGLPPPPPPPREPPPSTAAFAALWARDQAEAEAAAATAPRDSTDAGAAAAAAAARPPYANNPFGAPSSESRAAEESPQRAWDAPPNVEFLLPAAVMTPRSRFADFGGSRGEAAGDEMYLGDAQ